MNKNVQSVFYQEDLIGDGKIYVPKKLDNKLPSSKIFSKIITPEKLLFPSLYVLYHYGYAITTTLFRKELESLVIDELREEDKKIYLTRGDTKFSQVVRDMVKPSSHNYLGKNGYIKRFSTNTHKVHMIQITDKGRAYYEDNVDIWETEKYKSHVFFDLLDSSIQEVNDNDNSESVMFGEGGKVLRKTNVSYRDYKFMKWCRNSYLIEYDNKLKCECCGIVPAEIYGDPTYNSCIEVHHNNMLSKLDDKVYMSYGEAKKQTTLLCSTCHRGIHTMMRINPDVTVGDFINVYQSKQKQKMKL